RVVATNLDDEDTELTGWAGENEHDDQFDIAHNTFQATINDYFRDRAPLVADGDRPGILDEIQPDNLETELDGLDNLVIPGSAVRPLLDRPAAIEAIRAFVEDGGTLLVTDEAVQLLASLEVLPAEEISDTQVYAGHINWADREHPLADGVRGLARQTYEPMPLGFVEGENSPAWTWTRSAFEEAGGVTIGTLGPERANFGEISMGDGKIVALGALLPDPTEANYHPYGLDSYATTYTGNQLVRNTLGWELTFEQPPRVTESGVILPKDEEGEATEPTTAQPEGDQEAIPFPSLAPLALLGAALVLVERRSLRKD
ncbi:MAG: hypothetical protein R3185_08695, partial [Candidatus Thermoplasmatota archaeon]|nr:hypothetical protein [Candidatus Thermoplasmatota archaeon]